MYFANQKKKKKENETEQDIKKQQNSATFSGLTIFLKLRIGEFSDTQKPPMVVAECSKIFDVQCIWGRIFVSLEKIFVFKYS